MSTLGMGLGLGSFLLDLWGGMRSDQMGREDRQWFKDRYGEYMGSMTGLRDKWVGKQGTEVTPQMQAQIKAAALMGGLTEAQANQAVSDAVSQSRSTGAYALAEKYKPMYEGMYDQMSSKSAEMASKYGKEYTDLANSQVSDLEKKVGDIGKMYEDRTKKGMSMIQGFGDSARNKLDRDYSNLEGKQAISLAASGLGGTTAGASMAAGRERMKASDLKDLNESINTQKYNAYSGLSGDEARSKEQGLYNINNRSTSMLSDALNQRQSLDKWSLANALAAQEGKIQSGYAMDTLPMQMDIGLTSQQYTTALGAGTPPEYVPWQTTAGSALGNLSSQMMQYDIAQQQIAAQRDAANKNLFGNIFGSTVGAASSLGAAGIYGSALSKTIPNPTTFPVGGGMAGGNYGGGSGTFYPGPISLGSYRP